MKRTNQNTINHVSVALLSLQSDSNYFLRDSAATNGKIKTGKFVIQ